MGERTGISWTDATWNPVTGCSKVSAGCLHCYAEVMAKRLQASGSHRYANGFKVTLHEDVLDLPKKWKEPKRIFVNSMSDLFHEDVPFEFVDKVFAVMAATPQHTYQILTKRPLRMQTYSLTHEMRRNVWLGVTIEDAAAAKRLDLLKNTLSIVRFISFEPLIGDVGPIDLADIQWVIIGGESGPEHRPIQESWVMNIVERADALSIPVFFKQWGGPTPKSNGHLLRGVERRAFPTITYLRQEGQ